LESAEILAAKKVSVAKIAQFRKRLHTRRDETIFEVVTREPPAQIADDDPRGI
jgi:hypothetical protein